MKYFKMTNKILSDECIGDNGCNVIEYLILNKSDAEVSSEENLQNVTDKNIEFSTDMRNVKLP